MRRAERLFQIIQILRRSRAPVTADAIAAELETSKRSVYRDIAALVGQRAPIRGEAGVGYVLEADLKDRDVVFVPVAINYDRVLEDRVLISADEAGTRRFDAQISVILKFIVRKVWLPTFVW